MPILSIEIGINPILFNIGSFEVGWHGIMVVLAVIIGIGVSLWQARGTGIRRELIFSIAPWAILGGIVGARLFHVADCLIGAQGNCVYMADPVKIFEFWHGLSILGAILGGTLGVYIYTRIVHLPIGRLADTIAPGLLLATAVGRIGCTINGDACGTPTSLPWGFVYSDLPGVYAPSLLAQAGYPPTAATHPSPVYEIIWCLLVFAVIWRLRGRLKPDGSLFLLCLALYSFGRFFIEFTRVVIPIGVDVAGLHSPHFIALLVMAVCVPVLIYRMRKAGALGSGGEIEDV